MRGDKVKKRLMEQKKGIGSAKRTTAPPPSRSSAQAILIRPPRKAVVVVKSVTRDEINRFWRRKKMEEEEHLLAAQKAAARLRAQTLTEEDYKRFEQSLEDMMKNAGGKNNEELGVGIKDWWTKSKYAYLNQPATDSIGEDKLKRDASTYLPQIACSYSLAENQYASSFGVFKMVNIRSLVM